MKRAVGRLGMLSSAAVLIAGCGGSSPSAQPSSCVQIYFLTDATRSSEAVVRKQVEKDEGVRSVRFVSKEQALAALKKKYPSFANVPFGSNPVPDMLFLGVDHADVAEVRESLMPPRPPVEYVHADAKPCAS